MRLDDFPRIGDVAVDVAAVAAIAHQCDPALCRDSRKCCAAHRICVEEDELPALRAFASLAARYTTSLPPGDAADGIPGELFAGLYEIRRTEDGLCVFAFAAPDGRVLCSLHSAALDGGFDVREVKPRACLLWPLTLSGSRPRILSADAGAFAFPCTARRAPDGRLDAGVEDIIRCVLGEEFLARLAGAVASGRGATRP